MIPPDPLFREIKDAYSACDIRNFISLGGIWKIWGHPTIRTHEGLTDFREKGGPVKDKPNKKTLKLINGQFKLMLVEGYYSKHSRWPKVDTSQCCRRVQDMHKRNTWRMLSPTLFEPLIFGKNSEFDYFVDPTDLLSDTAITGGLSHWGNEFDSYLYEVLHNQPLPPVPSREETKVLLKYLSLESINIKNILDLIEERDIPDAWKIVVLVFKERE